MRFFKKLKKKLDYLNEEQIAQVERAFLTAEEAHKKQKRRTGEAYITHPVAVTAILADMHLDPESLMAALLHDVIEDTTMSKDVLAKKFGKSVAELVDGVTKLTQIEFKTRAEAQAEYFRKMVLAMAKDIRVIIVKLADRLHNMRTIQHLDREQQRRIATETLDIFAPIAHRLGMHDVSIELEDLALSACYPQRFRVIKEAITRARGNRKEILSSIHKTIKKGLSRSDIQDFELSGREKHIYGIYKKMKEKHIPFSQIMDVYAFRITVSTIDDCYRILGIVHSLYKPLPERFKDYIAIPKANAYQSLHTTLFGPYGVPIEIQIRTREMDLRANSGIASHWLYKANENDLSFSQIRAQQWVKSLIEMQQRTGSSLEFVEHVKIDLFPDEVYVFTPGGKIMELPVGATAVDFAYAVHTDIGNSCVAAKIDRQLMPLSTVLTNGQTVEVITSKNARPNPMWLDFVVTAKARSSIRHFLKNQRRAESIELGHTLLERALASRGIKLKKVPRVCIHTLLEETHLDSFEHLLEEVGMGNRIAMLEVNRLKKVMMRTEKNPENVEKIEAKMPLPLQIKGTEGMVVRYATCCYPIPGDPIIGTLQAGQGIVVHVEACKQVTKLRQHPDRCTTVRWSENVQGEFEVVINVEVLDQRGVLATIALAISNAGVNIEDIGVSERKSKEYIMSFKLRVRDRVNLANVLRELRKLKPVKHITRGQMS